MKKIIKSFMVIAFTFVIGYLYPITSYAMFTVPTNIHRGTYENLTRETSFIKINAEDCTVNIVYNSDVSKYITATKGWGYIANGSFSATFSKYLIKDINGNTLQVVNNNIGFSGTVTKTSSYIDIVVGGIIYEKTL